MLNFETSGCFGGLRFGIGLDSKAEYWRTKVFKMLKSNDFELRFGLGDLIRRRLNGIERAKRSGTIERIPSGGDWIWWHNRSSNRRLAIGGGLRVPSGGRSS